MSPRLRRGLLGAAAVLLLGYASIHAMVWRHALARLAAPPQRPADAALILGNRAYKDGRPNPCLTGRVDAGLALAKAGTVRQLVFSGGVDSEDGRIEAEVMEQHARGAGYTGALLLEPVSQSTRENLSMSRAVLQAAGVRSVVIVTEPYHLWRAERLAHATGFDRLFDVQFAAAPSACWQQWGMAFKGALREPLAIVNNAANGYLH
ncbi:YdcF family protein [Variovorax sp. M-6]|uniref:YdcF family protein n=1 Tax=Variovorax sp. M-6 TaxID=3233041 RepID=UPI003F9BD3E0